MAANLVDNRNRGVALLVAVIFASVMLAFGVLIGSLGYKQTLLTQSVKESQHAFYAADTGMECLLHADQAMNNGRGVFSDSDGIPLSAGATTTAFPCDGVQLMLLMEPWSGGSYTSASVDLASGKCVDLSIYKPTDGLGKTWIFAQGYSVDCATAETRGVSRFASRGLRAHY